MTEQRLKFKWLFANDIVEREFTMNSTVVPQIGSTVSLPDVLGTVTAIHFIYSRFDDWDQVIIKLDPVK